MQTPPWIWVIIRILDNSELESPSDESNLINYANCIDDSRSAVVSRQKIKIQEAKAWQLPITDVHLRNVLSLTNMLVQDSWERLAGKTLRKDVAELWQSSSRFMIQFEVVPRVLREEWPERFLRSTQPKILIQSTFVSRRFMNKLPEKHFRMPKNTLSFARAFDYDSGCLTAFGIVFIRIGDPNLETIYEKLYFLFFFLENSGK